jgi:hypothetical protein
MSSYDVRQDKYIETGMNFVTTVTRRILENLEGKGKVSLSILETQFCTIVICFAKKIMNFFGFLVKDGRRMFRFRCHLFRTRIETKRPFPNVARIPVRKIKTDQIWYHTLILFCHWRFVANCLSPVDGLSF